MMARKCRYFDIRIHILLLLIVIGVFYKCYTKLEPPHGNVNSIQYATVNENAEDDFDSKLLEQFAKYADNEKFIVMSYVDIAYVDLAINFFLTSIQRFGISNYLFISSDIDSCTIMSSRGAHCWYYQPYKHLNGSKASDYASKDFNDKMHARVNLVLYALRAGFTVLNTDSDIVFLTNPVPLVVIEAKGQDIVIQKNHEKLQGGCGGFYIANPTPKTIMLYESIFSKESTSTMDDQGIFNQVLNEFRKKKVKLNLKYLNVYQYAPGIVYWEKYKRMFQYVDPWLNGDKTNTVIVHNNWIVSKSAKIYRFKESLLWVNDENRYYSASDRKYISFGNPYDGIHNVRELEENALMNALAIGFILNRTVILPAFHCNGCKEDICNNSENICSLNAHYNVKQFDKYFGLRYREHTFLYNGLTPQAIRDSMSPKLFIESKLNLEHGEPTDAFSIQESQRIYPKDYLNGASVSEIIEWFGNNHEKVLRFHSLYGVFQGFSSQESKFAGIKNQLANGLVKGPSYRQQMK